MDVQQLVQAVQAGPWPQRVAAIRSVPAEFPGRQHQAVYAEVAGAYYAEHLAPHFHLVPWPEKYTDRAGFQAAYEQAADLTDGFTKVSPADLEAAIMQAPASVRIFRLMLGYTTKELAATVTAFEPVSLSDSAVQGMEEGRAVSARIAPAVPGLARQISAILTAAGGYAIPDEIKDKGFRGKTDKPDTEGGWATVQQWHANGVPYHELLYQRYYGGAFRQLQDAGGSKKGDLLEDPVETLFSDHGVPHIRTTTAAAQHQARERFGVIVQPAPDFVLHDNTAVRGLLECKSAGDGGTARDKAARFRNLRAEAQRLGGIPVLAVLDGLGWRRLNDALGPVVRDTDGRVFTTSTLTDLLDVDPVRDLIGGAP